VSSSLYFQSADGKVSHPLDGVRLERRVGMPVRWSIELDVSAKTSSTETLFRWIGSQHEPVGHVMLHSGSSPGNHLSSALICTGVQRSERDPNNVVFQAMSGYGLKRGVSADVDPFLPRYRVLSGGDIGKLVSNFRYFVKITNGIRAALSDVVFPEKDKACVVQAGLSDWDVLARLLAHFSNIKGERVVLTASSDPDTDERWIASWADSDAFRENSSIEGRKVRFTEPETIEISHLQSSEIDGDRRLLVGLPILRKRYDRTLDFKVKTWDEWVKRQVPLFSTDEQEIWCVHDTLRKPSNDRPTVSWVTKVDVLPPSLKTAAASGEERFPMWQGSGIVEKKGPLPWLRVALNGFDRSKHANEVWAKLTTPHSGKEGVSGLHLVPDEGSTVAVLWSGMAIDPVLVSGNVRQRAPRNQSPCMEFEDPFRAVLSEVQIDIDKGMRVKGTQPISVETQGVRVRLDRGKFRADRT